MYVRDMPALQCSSMFVTSRHEQVDIRGQIQFQLRPQAPARPAVALPSHRFSLAFGPDAGPPGIIGNPASYSLMRNVGAAPSADLGILNLPLILFCMYQLMFAGADKSRNNPINRHLPNEARGRWLSLFADPHVPAQSFG